MKFDVKVEGFKEMDRALDELPKSIGKAILRRVALAALQPMRAKADALAPKKTYVLADSIDVSTRARGARRAKGSEVEAFMGPASSARSITQEFGSFKEPAQPYMRPAWDWGKSALLEFIKKALWAAIAKSAARLARKTAKYRR